MSEIKLVVIGGGLAGLSAGCYARANGLDVTIVEHNLALGGVCTAWNRGPYLVDGCIQWLTGGPFLRLYEELGIVPDVALRPLEAFTTYRDARDKWTDLSYALCASQHNARPLARPERGDDSRTGRGESIYACRHSASASMGIRRSGDCHPVDAGAYGAW